MAKDNAWCHKCQKYHIEGTSIFRKHKGSLGFKTGTSIRSLTRGVPIKKR